MSSTACVKPKEITAAHVLAVLHDIATAEADRVDPRSEAGLLPRYLHRGQPNCLAARVLARLGYPTSVLRALDREFPTGELVHGGVQIAHSRHPSLRRLDDNARALLQHLQTQQDRGWPWGRIIKQAATRSKWFSRRHEKTRKPWLFA